MSGRRVAMVGLVGAVLIGCGTTDGAAPAAAPDCPKSDLQLVYTGAAGEDGGDVFGLTDDGMVRRLTDDGRSYHPASSPDGSRVVFSGSGGPAFDDPAGPTGLDLHVMASDGSDRRRLVDGDEDVAPAWSPDGTRIAFIRRGGPTSRILVMDPDDPASARVLIEPGEDSHDTDPAWSPDGKTLAFVRRVEDGQGWGDDTPHRLMVVDSDGTNARTVLDRDNYIGSPTWSPDAAALAFTLGSGGDRDGSIAVLDLADGSVEVVAEPARAPVWSASGRIYGYARPPAVADVSGGWRVTEFLPEKDGFSKGRAISATESIGFLYPMVGIDVPRCDGPESAAHTSDADVPDMLRVTDPVSGDDVEVLTREDALALLEPASYADVEVEAKLVHIATFGRNSYDPAVGLVWAVAPMGTSPVHWDDLSVFDATTGDFIVSGPGGGDEPWASLVDLAP